MIQSGMMEDILHKINQASLKFLVPLSIEDTYARIVDEACRLVKGDDGLIVREDKGKLITVYGSTTDAASYKVRQHGNSFKTFTEHRAVILNFEEIKRLYPRSKKITTRSILYIPLSYMGKSEGVLIIRTAKDKHFSQKETKILELFGSFASLAIKKNELYEETKQALDVRDHFISLVSHELRTPLTSINGYVQLLYSKMNEQETSEGKWVRELYSESKRLTRLVQDLLEINRIKQGQLQFVLEEVHFNKIIHDAIEQCMQNYPDRKFSLSNILNDSNDMLVGDYKKLLQVVSALLGNALKFSPKDSEVEVKIFLKNHQVYLHILDRGKGISHNDIERIFGGFYKSGDNHSEGIGVSLLLAKHIIHYHQGSIIIKSDLKKGTKVEVVLPQQKI